MQFDFCSQQVPKQGTITSNIMLNVFYKEMFISMKIGTWTINVHEKSVPTVFVEYLERWRLVTPEDSSVKRVNILSILLFCMNK